MFHLSSLHIPNSITITYKILITVQLLSNQTMNMYSVYPRVHTIYMEGVHTIYMEYIYGGSSYYICGVYIWREFILYIWSIYMEGVHTIFMEGQSSTCICPVQTHYVKFNDEQYIEKIIDITIISAYCIELQFQ